MCRRMFELLPFVSSNSCKRLSVFFTPKFHQPLSYYRPLKCVNRVRFLHSFG
jgi:hypothetical protein